MSLSLSYFQLISCFAPWHWACWKWPSVRSRRIRWTRLNLIRHCPLGNRTPSNDWASAIWIRWFCALTASSGIPRRIYSVTSEAQRPAGVSVTLLLDTLWSNSSRIRRIRIKSFELLLDLISGSNVFFDYDNRSKSADISVTPQSFSVFYDPLPLQWTCLVAISCAFGVSDSTYNSRFAILIPFPIQRVVCFQKKWLRLVKFLPFIVLHRSLSLRISFHPFNHPSSLLIALYYGPPRHWEFTVHRSNNNNNNWPS